MKSRKKSRKAKREPAPASPSDIDFEAAERLQKAIAKESTMAVRYLHYSLSVFQKGESLMAGVFAALALSEFIHALRLQQSSNGAHHTAQILGNALLAESEEIETLLEPGSGPHWAPWPEVRAAFQLVLKGGRSHMALLSKLTRPENRTGRALHICAGCGDILERAPAEPCTSCGAMPYRFIEFSDPFGFLEKL